VWIFLQASALLDFHKNKYQLIGAKHESRENPHLPALRGGNEKMENAPGLYVVLPISLGVFQ
jgi:hypothetical protein